MLGKLATYLRMCGYDAAYALDRDEEADDRLLELAREEGRLLVTRDAALARRAGDAGVLLESRDVTDQLAELRSPGFELGLSEPTRCSACNSELVEVGDGETTPEYAPDLDERRVWRCPACGKHFWKGSHWDRVAETLNGLSSE
ncbi:MULTISPECIES: Mut7-C RNAse domain-containing protein [Halorussus]|uniref:Mut7-C RNAse domain-containing protein n=1 Tax=Halorussus TaxID=1070314 RepID=UPI00209D69E0|nr:Mut7-C RNAse domain-containing protein [Halorussus vallis]USZ77737.1 Mut7-C RNAse domain-containing protein [Halorussus vallis]